MESKFLEIRSKKYQNNIARLIESRQKVRGDYYFDVEHLNDEIHRIFEAMVKVRNKGKVEYNKDELELYLKSYLPNWTSSMEFYINDLVLYERTNKDSLKVFQDGLFTTQRILFLGDKYANLGYTGNTDPNHVNHALNFLRSFAYPDVILLEAYRKQMPGPFKKGYPFHITLVNSLYLLLDGKDKEASEYIAEKMQIKSISNHKYNSATLMAIKAIADKDEQTFLLELNNMLSSQSKIVFPNFIMNYINLEAHSLYNLAGKIWGKSPVEPKSEFWDTQFVQYSREHKPELFIDFSETSPTFKMWLKDLPEEISVINLIEEFEKDISINLTSQLPISSAYLNSRSRDVVKAIQNSIEHQKKHSGSDCFSKENLINDIKKIIGELSTVKKEFDGQNMHTVENQLKITLMSSTYRIRESIYDYIFYERILNDNLKTFNNGLYTMQRIEFLSNAALSSQKDKTYSMVNFRASLPIFDKNLINEYMKILPGDLDSNMAHVVLANCFYMLLQKENEKASEYLKRSSFQNTLNEYDKHMILATQAIADKDEAKFLMELDKMSSLYLRYHFYHNLADFINIHAVGLYNLARHIWKNIPKQPESEYFDSEFTVFGSQNQPQLLPEIIEISPTLNKWLENLPFQLEVSDLVEEIERNTF